MGTHNSSASGQYTSVGYSDMDKQRLDALERRVQACEGVRTVPGTQNRDNETSMQWASDDARAIDALIERGGWSQRATLLNLDTCRGNGTAERPGTISGLDGLAIEAHPRESMRIARTMRQASGHTPTPREVATELLGLDEKNATLLFDGPNWAGNARAWIQPHEAAQAVRHVRRELPAEQVWAHVDRDQIARAHEMEDPDFYLAPQVEAAVASWEERVRALGHDPETGIPAAELTDIDYEVERTGALEHARSTQAWGTIAATARIHPSARVGHGVDIGDFAEIERDVVIDNYASIESDARIGQGTRIASEVSIGERTAIGADCTVAMPIGAECTVGDRCELTATLDGQWDARVPRGSQVPSDTRLGAEQPAEPENWFERVAEPPVPAPAMARGAAEERARGRWRAR